MTDNPKKIIKPQKGPQEQFLSTSADIAIMGGAAGGGKTYSLLLEPIRHYNNSQFSAVIFRESYPQIHNPGGLWDTAKELYAGEPLNGRGLGGRYWKFPTGMYVAFRHLAGDQDALSWHGAQVPLIMYDELTQFSEYLFFYLMSRNRSTSGVKPYVRATCNPDPDSWVAKFVDWWISEDGYADPDKSGRVRWMLRMNDVIYWADRPQDFYSMFPDVPHSSIQPKSVTFILSTLYNNQILMEKDPGYLANLLSLSTVERERLLGDKERGGNWRIRLEAGMVFKHEHMLFRYRKDELPQFTRVIQAIDTSFKDGVHNDYSVIATWATDGINYYLLDLWRAKVEYTALKQAIIDNYAKWRPDTVLIEDAASGQSVIQELDLTTAIPIQAIKPAGSKIARAESVSPIARARKLRLPDTEYHPEDTQWVADWIKEHVGFPPPEDKVKRREAHDDMVDTTSMALRELRDSLVNTYHVVNLLSDEVTQFEHEQRELEGANSHFSTLLQYWDGKLPYKNPNTNTYAVDYYVGTRNPTYLDSVANNYWAALLTDGEGWYSTNYLKENNYYVLRCYSDFATVRAAIENQGYGQVVGLREKQPIELEAEENGLN